MSFLELLGFKKKRTLENYLRMDGWRCEICKEFRPDEDIDVLSYPLKVDGEVMPGATRNLKYCNDRDACIEGASARQREGV